MLCHLFFETKRSRLQKKDLNRKLGWNFQTESNAHRICIVVSSFHRKGTGGRDKFEKIVMSTTVFAILKLYPNFVKKEGLKLVYKADLNVKWVCWSKTFTQGPRKFEFGKLPNTNARIMQLLFKNSFVFFTKFSECKVLTYVIVAF